MVIFTWFLFLVPPFQQKIRHLFMNKSACAEVVGSSAICQGTYKESYEESCPSGNQKRSKLTTSFFFFFYSWEKTWTADLGRFPQMREKFLKSSLPEGRFQHAIGAMERVRTTSTVLPLPKKDYTMMTYQGVVTSLIGEKESSEWLPSYPVSL